MLNLVPFSAFRTLVVYISTLVPKLRKTNRIYLFVPKLVLFVLVLYAIHGFSKFYKWGASDFLLWVCPTMVKRSKFF